MNITYRKYIRAMVIPISSPAFRLSVNYKTDTLHGVAFTSHVSYIVPPLPIHQIVTTVATCCNTITLATSCDL